MAAGSGPFDEQGQLQVTEDHVQAALAVTSLLGLAAPCGSPLTCHTGLGRPALLANQWTKGQLVGQFNFIPQQPLPCSAVCSFLRRLRQGWSS